MKKKVTSRFSNILVYVLILSIISAFTACKKNKRGEDPQPDILASLTAKITAKWQLTGGRYEEFDKAGNVIFSEDLAGRNPAPIYDIKAGEILYRTDDRGTRDVYYRLSVKDGRSRILLESVEYFDITDISETEMTWLQDMKSTDPDSRIQRLRQEAHFRKL